MECGIWQLVLNVATQADDLPDFNADKRSQMFGTSAYCINNSDDTEKFDPTYLIPITQEYNEPLFDKFIKQDIALSNP